jgi:two-component system chemotaxis response regulator CheY
MDIPTLLLVDDDRFVRRLLRDMLADTGLPMRVLEAADGEEALALVASEQPALVFLDLFMPLRNGLDLLPDLRAASPRTRVVVISANQEDPLVARALAAGASGFVGKPFQPEEITRVAREALGG